MSAAPNTTTSSDFASRWSLMITWGLFAKAKKPFSRHRRCQSRCQTAQMAPASGVITLHITNIRSEAVETRPRAKANVPQSRFCAGGAQHSSLLVQGAESMRAWHRTAPKWPRWLFLLFAWLPILWRFKFELLAN